MYDHDMPYIPRDRYELLDIIAKNKVPGESQRPENQGKTDIQLYWMIRDEFKTKSEKELYAIYFSMLESKPKKIKVSRLEKKIEGLQLSLF